MHSSLSIPVSLLLLLAHLCSPFAAQSQTTSNPKPAYLGRVSHDRGGFNPALKPFYHGVASGDPTASSLVIWTRVTPEGNETSIPGNFFVATDTSFGQLVIAGTFTAEQSRDYTVKIELTNLNPGSTYYYYFQALNANSLIGRAKTCPEGVAADQLKFAVVSCSNYEGGFFNAYRMIAERNDLDAVIHLGDYIYEYGAGAYGIPLPDRTNEPPYEIITLADYRTRYSLYRLDPDLIRLHQQHTVVSIWDDHESANDSYVDGADNHQANEGDWETRKAISKQVYFEWMPVRNNPTQQVYRRLSYGNLCDLILLDTRLEGRVQPPQNFDTPDVPARNMISPTQYAWLMDQLKQSDARWKVIGNQVLFSTFNVGFAGGAFDGTPDPFNLDSIRQAENIFIDNWESYPTQRNSIIDSLRTNDIDNVVIVTGDSHSSWAFDVTKQAVLYPSGPLNLPQSNPYNAATGQGYTPATGAGSWAVEFATPSISSPNFDEAIGAALTNQFEGFLVNPIPPLGLVYNPHLKYVDLDRHGYFLLSLNTDRAQADYFYVPTVAADTFGEAFNKAAYTLDGQNRVLTGDTPAPPKAVQDVPTPEWPPTFSVSTSQADNGVAVFSYYPNPASDMLFWQAGFSRRIEAALAIYDTNGRRLRDLFPMSVFEPGVYNAALPLGDLPNGTYWLRLEGKQVYAMKQIVVVR